MESNKFELTGKINHIDTKYSETGKCHTNILMAKKGKADNEFQSFNIVFFDELAEEAGDLIKKGDVVNVTGKLAIKKYKTKEGNEAQCVNFCANSFSFAKYDLKKKQYVEHIKIKEAKKQQQNHISNVENKRMPWEK